MLDSSEAANANRKLSADQEDVLVLVTAASENFAMPMCVALRSVLEHANPSWPVVVFVMNDGILPGTQARVEKILAGARADLDIEWLTPDLSLIKGLVKPTWHTRTTYLRFLIQYLVPERYERVLYIDSDVVVRDDVTKLWDIDMGDYPFFAAVNFAPSLLADSLVKIRDRIEPPPPGTLYCNAGVMLMNMPRWREMDLSMRAIAFLLAHGEAISFGDQDGLNGVLRGQWGVLEPRWNVQMLNVDHLGYDRFEAPEAERMQREVLENAAIIHYTGPYKPWNLRYRGPCEDIFHSAYIRSGWRNTLLCRLEVAVWAVSHGIWRKLHGWRSSTTAT
jgi:lipopolysaccharide biosynthesis glycosyltransferase